MKNRNIDDCFLVNNVLDVQEMVRDMNLDIPISLMIKKKQLRKLQVNRSNIVLLLMKHV